MVAVVAITADMVAAIMAVTEDMAMADTMVMVTMVTTMDTMDPIIIRLLVLAYPSAIHISRSAMDILITTDTIRTIMGIILIPILTTPTIHTATITLTITAAVTTAAVTVIMVAITTVDTAMDIMVEGTDTAVTGTADMVMEDFRLFKNSTTEI